MTLKKLRNKDKNPNQVHKEQTKGRISSDKKDQKKLKEFIKTCINPLDVESHSENILCNIHTGEIAASQVNTNKALEIGCSQLKSFRKSLPEGFRSTIKKAVVLIGSKTKASGKGTPEEYYNTELLFARVIFLLSLGQIEFEDLFEFELSPLPTSLCCETEEPRYTKAKSVMKNKLKVEISSRLVKVNVVVIDGCGMLHAAVHWPKGGTVGDLINGVKKFVMRYLRFADVYLVFDSYYDYSPKSNTRAARVGNFKLGHELSLQSPLPPKDDTLSCTKSKVQLIQHISEALVNSDLREQNRLVVTSNDHCPVELIGGEKTLCPDLGTGHEEADNIIIQQVHHRAQHACSIKGYM